MIEPRLSAEMTVQSLIRKIGQEGGFGTVIQRGDRISGAILILCVENGANLKVLEKMPTLDGPAQWQRIWPQDTEKKEGIEDYLARRKRYDPDLWLIELDIPEAERLVAEMTFRG